MKMGTSITHARIARAVLLSATAMTWFAATPARAQTATVDNGQLSEIIVTATKRAQSLQDVPVSVTVLSADIVERNNVRDVTDIVKLAPSLVISYGTQPANFSINLRGIGTYSNGIAVESDVAVVIDDVPLGFQAAAFKDVIDVERIEVLRGPQSTLFGKSAIAGVLNITTQAPTREFSGKATMLLTDDSETRFGFTASGPISDQLRVRVTAAKSDFGGIMRNLTTGQRVNGSDSLTLTGKLEWTPTEDWTVQIAPRYNRTNSTCCVGSFVELTPGLFYQGLPQAPASVILRDIPIGPRNVLLRNDVRSGGDSEAWGATLRVNHSIGADSFLGAANLTYIGSYDRFKLNDFQDVDGTESPFLLYFPVSAPTGINSGASIVGNFRVRSTTHELRLTSAGNQPVKYVLGLWYARNELSRFFKRGPVFSLAQYDARSNNSNYAAFGELTWDVTPTTGLIGGLRVNRQEINYTFSQQRAVPFLEFGKSDGETAVTGRVGITQKLTPQILAFATYSTGYKGQAYDLISPFNARYASAMPVKSERANNIELGLKTTLFDRRLYLNVTAFRAEFKGFQTSVTASLPDGTFLSSLNSIGKLRTQGIEVDALARVTQNLTLNAAAAYIDAKVVDFPNGPCYPGQTVALGCYVDGTGSSVQNLAGAPLNNTPRFKFNIGGEYKAALGGNLDGFVNFAYRHQSAINFSLSQDARTIQPAYGILDLGIALGDRNGRYKVSLNANNVFDTAYAINLFNGTGGFSAPGVTAVGKSWQPARDAFRYLSVRFDARF